MHRRAGRSDPGDRRRYPLRGQLRRELLRARHAHRGPRWKFATGGERRFEAKGLHGLTPKSQTFVDPFDVFLSSPVVAGGIVYFGSGDGNLYALDARSGS